MNIFNLIQQLFNSNLSNSALSQLSGIPIATIKNYRKASNLNQISLGDANRLAQVANQLEIKQNQFLNRTMDIQIARLKNSIDQARQSEYRAKIILRTPRHHSKHSK